MHKNRTCLDSTVESFPNLDFDKNLFGDVVMKRLNMLIRIDVLLRGGDFPIFKTFCVKNDFFEFFFGLDYEIMRRVFHSIN